MNSTTIGRLLRIACSLSVLLLVGCYPAVKVPIDTLRYDAPGSRHRILFVYLPGNGDSLSAFGDNGLVQAVRSRNLPIDIIAVNAHVGYYINGTIFVRLKQDVIDPAKANGYTTIWLVGNSLGGYGSISYIRQYPGDITGIVLLGPFPGEKKIIREIAKAGGLRMWNPGDPPRDPREAWDRELWKWIRDEALQKCSSDKADRCPSRIYLGYGSGDRFSYGQSLMAQSLPPEHVFEIDGGHNWRTWKKLWNLILDRIEAEAKGIHADAS